MKGAEYPSNKNHQSILREQSIGNFVHQSKPYLEPTVFCILQAPEEIKNITGAPQPSRYIKEVDVQLN